MVAIHTWDRDNMSQFGWTQKWLPKGIEKGGEGVWQE